MGNGSARQRVILSAGLAVLMMMAVAGSSLAACLDDQVSLRWSKGQARFTVEVADEFEERNRGLMHRDKLGQSAGMLFVYEEPQHARFWMRNTLIPLDMIFMNDQGLVTHIHEDAIPHDETPIDGGQGVRFVLEINGGLAKRLGIVEGAEMQNPVIGEKALWKCVD